MMASESKSSLNGQLSECAPKSSPSLSLSGRKLKTLAFPFAALEGCYHNGTVYGDGSLVPTMEPCLSCQCANRTLLCSLRVCHEQPVPPPRGCVIVHHKNKCCPHMFCKRFHKRPMVSDMDRKIVNFLDEFEQEQQAIHERYEEFAGDENALRRRSEDPDSFDECKTVDSRCMLIHSSVTHPASHPSPPDWLTDTERVLCNCECDLVLVLY